MSKRILLIDVDGTVLDRKKLKELQFSKSEALFGEHAHHIWDAYEELKLQFNGNVDVDRVIINAQEKIRSIDLVDTSLVWDVFYDVDFKSCVDREGWNALLELSKKEKIDLLFFSQGGESTMPGISSYQEVKIKRMGLDGDVVGTRVFQDKMSALPTVIEECKKEGYVSFGFIDNEAQKLAEAQKVVPELQVFHAVSEGENSPLLTAVHAVERTYSVLTKEGGNGSRENLA